MLYDHYCLLTLFPHQTIVPTPKTGRQPSLMALEHIQAPATILPTLDFHTLAAIGQLYSNSTILQQVFKCVSVAHQDFVFFFSLSSLLLFL